MKSTQKDEHSCFKMAQLWRFINSTSKASRLNYLRNRVINEILKDDFNINYKVDLDISRDITGSGNDLKDCSALHFSYYSVNDISIFRTLIENGVDFTLKNGHGQTVLHLIMAKSRSFNIEKEIPFINSVLSAHVKLKNSVNPHDHNGYSHLHAACIANGIEAVELFLDNGASIDEAVNLDAPQFAGYTPLHFAVQYCRLKVAQILVKRGTNLNSKDANEMSPLDLIVRRKLVDRSAQKELLEKEQMIKFLLENGGVSTAGLSSLQVAFTLKDLTIAERFLNQGANVDYVAPINSSFCSGHTTLDFAIKNSIEAVKMLLLHGAKITFTKGSTFVDSFLRTYDLQNFCDILSCSNSTKEIRLSDGETKLLDLISAMNSLTDFKDFLRNKIKDTAAVVSIDSVLWPGYTILHLPVTISGKVVNDNNRIVEECLNQGLSLNVRDAREQTPIHLAFSQGKAGMAKLLLKHLDQHEALVNLADEDNLSYLHIACAIKDKALAERLLSVSDPNVEFKGKMEILEAGATPLHVATAVGSREIADMLLRRGANLHATTEAGLTPIHYLLKYVSPYVVNYLPEVLFRSLLANLEDRVVDGLGLSYLHVACHFKDMEAVEKLLELGSNVNAVISYDKHSDNSASKSALMSFNEYFNFTPLDMVLRANFIDENLITLLLRHDVCKMPLDNKIVLRCFFELLWSHDVLQNNIQKMWGLTKLHIACFLKDEEAVKSVLNNGIDVNARVSADSTIFAGCTPLHLLITINDSKVLTLYMPRFDAGEIMQLLLDRGADVTIANAEKNTPIHVFREYQSGFFDGERCTDLLLNAQTNFSINPANDEGLSHFHIACLWHNYECVEKFLQHGSVDVNEPIDFFAKQDAGCTPLHMALSLPTGPNVDWTKLSRVVDLLVQYGANVAVIDVDGETPLHKPAVLYSPGMGMLEKLVGYWIKSFGDNGTNMCISISMKKISSKFHQIRAPIRGGVSPCKKNNSNIYYSYGGDVKTENMLGLTPIDIWPRFRGTIANYPDYATVFEKFNYKINRWNRLTGEGYIGKTFLFGLTDISQNPKFQNFLQSSDVRSVDYAGRTAIHNVVANPVSMYLVQNKNYIYAIESFMKLGIDIDHQDDSGQTALHYAARMENTHGIEALLACGADINIVDESGKSAFYYAEKYIENKSYMQSSIFPHFSHFLRYHVQKLQYLNMEVSQLNRDLVKKIDAFDDPSFKFFYKKYLFLPPKFLNQLEMTKTLDIGVQSLTLNDFLCETGAVSLCTLLPKFKRDMVDNFFRSIDLNKFSELRGIIILQHRKMMTRVGLIDSALSCLRTLLGFSVPDLCEQISRFLLNSDLQNMIEPTTVKSRKRKEITN